MMKQIALILALVLLLTACVLEPSPAETTLPRTSAPEETTLPPETTAPVETIVPVETTVPEETTVPVETTAPTVSIEDHSEYEALLSSSSDPNWLVRSLGCLYERPEDIDLYYMFYLGVNHPGSWDDISPESRQSLIDQGFMDEFDLQLMPVHKLEEALQSTFGIGLADVTIPEYWGYIEAEDAYCSNHSDAFFPGVPTITAVEDDGVNIRIHYTMEGYWIPDSEDFLDTANLILTLVRKDDGTIHAVSNLLPLN